MTLELRRIIWASGRDLGLAMSGLEVENLGLVRGWADITGEPRMLEPTI